MAKWISSVRSATQAAQQEGSPLGLRFSSDVQNLKAQRASDIGAEFDAQAIQTALADTAQRGQTALGTFGLAQDEQEQLLQLLIALGTSGVTGGARSSGFDVGVSGSSA